MKYKYPFNDKVTFTYGLFGAGKSHAIYQADKRDCFHDMVFSLDDDRKSDKYYTTSDYFRVRGNNHFKVMSLPLYDLDTTKCMLISHKKLYHVKNILADEAQRVDIKTLIQLIKMLRSIYPDSMIKLFGILMNCYNNIDPHDTANYLLRHCPSAEIHCRCQLCHRQATKILMIYHGRVLTKQLAKKIANKKGKKEDAVRTASLKYHVCDCHFSNPPIERLASIKPAIKHF